MKLLKEKLNIDFMGMRKLAVIFSSILIIISIASLAIQGLNLGVDFTGGTLVEVGYDKAVELESIRSGLAASEFGEATVQYFGSASDILIRVAPREGVNTAEISGSILELLRSGGQAVEMRRVEFVGPQVGEELTEDGGLAMLYALLGILIYVALRFQMRFSFGAIAALVHDVIITIGVFSVADGF